MWKTWWCRTIQVFVIIISKVERQHNLICNHFHNHYLTFTLRATLQCLHPKNGSEWVCWTYNVCCRCYTLGSSWGAAQSSERSRSTFAPSMMQTVVFLQNIRINKSNTKRSSKTISTAVAPAYFQKILFHSWRRNNLGLWLIKH